VACPIEEWFKFVQVKSIELDQLWSFAKICGKATASPANDGKQLGACIVERSLAHDRGDENAVSAWSPNFDHPELGV
jgi:hypothetical protein